MLGHFFKVGFQANAGEGKSKAPGLEFLDVRQDFGSRFYADGVLEDKGKEQGGSQKAQDKFGESVPDFRGANSLILCLIYLGGEEHSHSEGDKADQDILNHFYQSSYLL